jgi:hypothetical protein
MRALLVCLPVLANPTLALECRNQVEMPAFVRSRNVPLGTTGAGLGKADVRWADTEGFAIRPRSNQIFIAFDSGVGIAQFIYSPTLPAEVEALPPVSDCLMF